MKVELHSEIPDRQFGPRIAELVKGAFRVDIAVAFVTEFGAREIQTILSQLEGQAQVRLLVSILFPTDLEAIRHLAERIDVHIHRGREQVEEKLHWQFHSKLVLIERRDESRAVVVGSHNWTQNGLNGGNLEASLIVDCAEGDSVVGQVREHIAACRRLSEPFDPSNMATYRAIQWTFHPSVDAPDLSNFPGFEPAEGIVILAENTVQEFDKSRRLFFHVPSAESRQVPYRRPVWVFLYPEGSLFGKKYPLAMPLLLEGQVGTNDDDPDRRSGVIGYWIRALRIRTDRGLLFSRWVVTVAPPSHSLSVATLPFIRPGASHSQSAASSITPPLIIARQSDAAA